METVSFTRQLSVAENVDVLVVGAGPAGIGAAVCAATSGMLSFSSKFKLIPPISISQAPHLHRLTVPQTRP